VAIGERRRQLQTVPTGGRAGAAGRPSRAALALATAVVLSLAFAHHARGATYKWVDDKGVTHYSDKLPVEAVNRSNTVLDKQAIPIRKVDAAPTSDQVMLRQTDTARAQATAREQEIQNRRDRALIQSYTSEDEIDLARNRALLTIDAQLDAARAFSADLVKRKDTLLARKTSSGDKFPVGEERELEATVGEIAKQQALIEQKQKERDATVAKYDADKARWRELRAIADAKDPAARVSGRSTADAVPAAASGAATLRR
jgi:hypothetical protein